MEVSLRKSSMSMFDYWRVTRMPMDPGSLSEKVLKPLNHSPVILPKEVLGSIANLNDIPE